MELTANQEDKNLLTNKPNLPKKVLIEVAKRRSISVSRRNKEEIRNAILKNIDRQEGYNRL